MGSDVRLPHNHDWNCAATRFGRSQSGGQSQMALRLTTRHTVLERGSSAAAHAEYATLCFKIEITLLQLACIFPLDFV
jgi:hypothetical protein